MAIKFEKKIKKKMISIAKIRKIIKKKKKKNKHLASASIVSFLGREMIKIHGLGTDFG